MMKKIALVSGILLISQIAVAGDGTIRRPVKPVPNQYLVKLLDTLAPADVQPTAEGLLRAHGGKMRFVFTNGVLGFSFEGPEAVAAAIARNPLVDFVEANGIVTISGIPGQQNPPWHLDRIDQRSSSLDGWYYQDCQIVQDAVIYIVDTGVKKTHQEFWTSSTDPTSRVLEVPGQDIVGSAGGTDSATNPCPLNPPNLCIPFNDYACLRGGHGTAVASIAAGRVYGVAKLAKIIPVRAFDCGGSAPSDRVISGLQFIYADKATRPQGGVVNLSFEFPWNDPRANLMEQQIDALVNDRNLTVTAAAGNGNVDAVGITPARHSRGRGYTVITAGGSNTHDGRWWCNPNNWFEGPCVNVGASNWGQAIDIFAPAQNIAAANIRTPDGQESDTAERMSYRSGTSFASPIIAGSAARLIMGSYGTLTPSLIWSTILGYATTGAMIDLPHEIDPDGGPLNGSPNRLIYMPPPVRCRMDPQQ